MKLTMTFTGHCLFLQRFGRVLLPDARQPRLSKNNASAFIPAHYAYLRFPLETELSVDAHLKRFDFKYVNPVTSVAADHVICLLDQMQITLDPPPEGHLIVNRKPPSNPKYPDPKVPGDDETVYWVADLAEIHEESGYVDEIYILEAPPPNIAAFALFDPFLGFGAMPGLIKCNRVPDDHSWEFIPALAAVNRALAIGVAAEMTLPDVPVVKIVLRSTDVAEHGREFVIELKAKPDGAGGYIPIEITVGNSPLEAILQVSHKHPPLNGIPNYDFELFYELSKRKTSTLPVPVCRATAYKRKDLGSENCPVGSSKP